MAAGEPWWTWRWDRVETYNQPILYKTITRWRRGCFFTLYRMYDGYVVEWWIYLPFNIAFAFMYPKKKQVAENPKAKPVKFFQSPSCQSRPGSSTSKSASTKPL